MNVAGNCCQSWDHHLVRAPSIPLRSIRFRAPRNHHVCGVDGVTKYANRWNRNNFGPRLGFAWKVAGQYRGPRRRSSALYTESTMRPLRSTPAQDSSIQGSFSTPDNGVTPRFYLQNGLPAICRSHGDSLTPGFRSGSRGQKPTTAIDYFRARPVNTDTFIRAASIIQHEFTETCCWTSLPGDFWPPSALSGP